MQTQEFTGEKDLPLVRVFDLGNNKLFMKRSDPYGFWSLSLERGALPDPFRGDYTTPSDAEKAVKSYLASKGKDEKPIP